MAGSNILYQIHIMWYESKMLYETLDSLKLAKDNSPVRVDIEVCINTQTYLEQPIVGTPEEMVKKFIDHEALRGANLTFKTDKDPFYNIGDWRREVYSNEHKYTVWGESDCLIPSDYFYILSEINLNTPHIVTLASRKMWDYSWQEVEHEKVAHIPIGETDEDRFQAPIPLNTGDVIDYGTLEEVNNDRDIKIIKASRPKIDGALVSISSGINTPFIAPDMHFVREDTCFEQYCLHKNIPQYIVKTRMKGHNYKHPLKRTNTKATRNDDLFKQYAEKSQRAFAKFIKTL